MQVSVDPSVVAGKERFGLPFPLPLPLPAGEGQLGSEQAGRQGGVARQEHPQEQGADEGQRNTDGRPHSSRPLSNSALHKVHELTLPPKEAALAALGGGGGGSHRQGEGGFAVRGGFAGMLEAVRDALESGKDSARNRPAEPF